MGRERREKLASWVSVCSRGDTLTHFIRTRG